MAVCGLCGCGVVSECVNVCEFVGVDCVVLVYECWCWWLVLVLVLVSWCW